MEVLLDIPLDIQQISVQGNIFIPTTTILATVESKVGLPYNPNVVKEDIQRITPRSGASKLRCLPAF